MSHRMQLTLFLCATLCLATGMGLHDSIFNYYLRDTFALSAGQRGWLELPRELPGFLVVFMAGVLCMLPVTRLGYDIPSVFSTCVTLLDQQRRKKSVPQTTIIAPVFECDAPHGTETGR